jgi:hypothetical protein
MRNARGSRLPVERFISALYGGRSDGGPDFAAHQVRTQMHRLRRRLEPHAISILTVGPAGAKGYMIDPAHYDRFESLLASMQAMDVDIARDT